MQYKTYSPLSNVGLLNPMHHVVPKHEIHKDKYFVNTFSLQIKVILMVIKDNLNISSSTGGCRYILHQQVVVGVVVIERWCLFTFAGFAGDDSQEAQQADLIHG